MRFTDLSVFFYYTANSNPLVLGKSLIFLLFGTMFYRMSVKHTKRIMGYSEERQPFWRFFDLKAYIIMAVMMGGGIGLRAAGVFPNQFVAFFYSGLGCALELAGILFIRNFISSHSGQIRTERTGQQ